MIRPRGSLFREGGSGVGPGVGSGFDAGRGGGTERFSSWDLDLAMRSRMLAGMGERVGSAGLLGCSESEIPAGRGGLGAGSETWTSGKSGTSTEDRAAVALGTVGAGGGVTTAGGLAGWGACTTGLAVVLRLGRGRGPMPPKRGSAGLEKSPGGRLVRVGDLLLSSAIHIQPTAACSSALTGPGGSPPSAKSAATYSLPSRMATWTPSSLFQERSTP